MIRTKDTKYDDELCGMGNRLICYPLVHKEALFNYLMSDNYYFKSNLYKTMGNTSEIRCMRKIHNLQNTNNRKILITEEEIIFGEKDIVDMFDYFKRNNFREKSICEYVLPNQ